MPATYALPTREERDRIIRDDYPDDARPPVCELHSNPTRSRAACNPCLVFDRWRRRMRQRFKSRNLKFAFDERRITDWDTVCGHVKALREGGMLLTEIARAAKSGTATVHRLLRDVSGRQYISTAVARRLLAIPVPAHQYQLVASSDGSVLLRVDPTGSHRRIQAACLNGHSINAQATRLGYHYTSINRWMQSASIPIAAAEAIAHLYPALIEHRGTDKLTVKAAQDKGWLPARYYPPDRIDDPTYKPLRRLTTAGVRRRLRALAWMGQGPKEVAEAIGENTIDVSAWTDGSSHPAYVAHLITGAYEQLSARFGPAQHVARRAREQGWASPMAWHDIDIDLLTARPQIMLQNTIKKSDLPLQSQIDLALLGLVPAADLVHTEKVTVVTTLHRRGWSDPRIGMWLRWSTDEKLAGGSVCQFRVRHGITGYGTDLHAWGSLVADRDFVVTPAA